jgi:Zn-dependent metalloprotease
MLPLPSRRSRTVTLLGLGLLTLWTGGAAAQAPRRLTLAATNGLAIRQADSIVDRLARAGALRMRRVQADTLLPDRTHQRMVQYYAGLPVHGGEIARQLDGGLTVSVFGQLYDGIDIDPIPTLSPDAARQVIETAAGGPLNPATSPALTVLPLDGGAHALVYDATVYAGGESRRYFVDAHDGSIVDQYSVILTQGTVGTGLGVNGDRKKIAVTPLGGQFVADDSLRPVPLATYDMAGRTDRVGRVLNGSVVLAPIDLAADPDNAWADPASVDGHVHSGWTYDYFFRAFGFQAVDGNNLRIISLVHPADRADFPSASSRDVFLFYLNAFYCPGCGSDGKGLLVYGEGLPEGEKFLGSRIDYFSGALDIVAHEVTHAVTFFTSRLEARGVPGALNEGFSDIMGTAAEFFFQPPGDGVLQADYLIGEDILEPLLAGLSRSLEDPARFGDRDHLSKLFTDFADNGGVHTNSTIASHAFYLAVEGGTNRTSGISVNGVGRPRLQEVAEAFFRGFAFLLPSDATFALARSATLQSAQDLDPTGELRNAIANAWRAVGVQ